MNKNSILYICACIMVFSAWTGCANQSEQIEITTEKIDNTSQSKTPLNAFEKYGIELIDFSNVNFDDLKFDYRTYNYSAKEKAKESGDEFFKVTYHNGCFVDVDASEIKEVFAHEISDMDENVEKVCSQEVNYSVVFPCYSKVQNLTQDVEEHSFAIYRIDTGEPVVLDNYFVVRGSDEDYDGWRGECEYQGKKIKVMKISFFDMKFTKEDADKSVQMKKYFETIPEGKETEQPVVYLSDYQYSIVYPLDFDFDEFEGFALGVGPIILGDEDQNKSIYEWDKDTLKNMTFIRLPCKRQE